MNWSQNIDSIIIFNSQKNKNTDKNDKNWKRMKIGQEIKEKENPLILPNRQENKIN
jgi:hypothetical protein